MQDYNEYREQMGLPKIIPSFRKHIVTLSLSDEAVAGLEKLAGVLTPARSGSSLPITQLVENIGLSQLYVMTPPDITAKDGVTTQQCYEAGIAEWSNEGILGFEALFGMRSRVFEEAYWRGYFEGKAQQKGSTVRRGRPRKDRL